MFSLTPNRLTKAHANVSAKIAENLTDADKLETFEREMDISFQEHFAFQNAQARAHASGKLTTEEAQIVYVSLGEVGSDSNGGWAQATDLATKVVVTMLMGELMTGAGR